MKHIMVSFLAAGAIQLCNIASGVLAARLLLPQGRGELAVIILWSSIIATVGFLSIDQAVAYWSALRREHAIRLTILAMLLATGLAAISVSVGFAILPSALESYRPEVLSIGRLYLVYIPLSYFGMVILAYFQGSLRLTEWSLIRTVMPVGYVLGILVFLALGSTSVRDFVIASLLANAAVIVLGMALMVQRVPSNWLPNLQDLPRVIRYGAGVHAAAIVATGNLRLDQVLIALFMSPADLGYYVVAMSVAGGISLIASTLVPLAFPKIVSQATPEGKTLVFGRYLRLVIFAAAASTIVLFVFATWIVRTLFGEAFAPADDLVRILVLGALALATKMTLYAGLKAQNRLLPISRTEIICLVVNAAALVVLLPRLGLTGAALAYAITQVMGAAIAAMAVSRTFETGMMALAVPTRADWDFIRAKLHRSPDPR